MCGGQLLYLPQAGQMIRQASWITVENRVVDTN